MKTLLVALNAQYAHVNLALRQIMDCLDGCEVSLFEGHINMPFRHILEDIGRRAPDAVGFSAYIWNAPLIWRLCRALRRALPGAILFAGGPEAECDPQAAFCACGALDYVLAGEGETVTGPFLRALGRGEDPSGLPGVCRMEDGKCLCAPPPPPMDPARWSDVWRGGALRGLEERILYIETSRGCPYRCAYCLSSVAGPVRALEAGEAIRRLTAMAEAGARLIKLVDRTFNFDRARAVRIWDGLIRHSRETGLLPRYHFEIGAHLLDEEAFSVLARAPEGLFQFEAGVQSTDPQVLRGVGRSIGFEAVRAPLARVREMGNIPLHTDLIAALPGEDLKTFARSFDQTWQIGAQRLQLGFLKVLPASPLRLRARELGLVYEPDPPYEALSTPQLSFSDICLLKDVETALDWYYNSGRYPLTLRYLLETSEPFALFCRIAQGLREGGALDAPRRERERALSLLRLFSDGALPDLIAHDLLSCGLGAQLPPEIDRREDEELRALLRRTFHPVRGQRARRCAWDVVAYARGEALVKRETVALYS